MKIFSLTARFLISPQLGRPFFAKNTNYLALTNLTSNRYSVPMGSSADLHNEERCVVRMDGRDGMEYQKFPSLFFLLCGHIENLYTTPATQKTCKYFEGWFGKISVKND